MNSARIRLPNQSTKPTMYKSWNGGKPPKSSTSKPLQDEIEKFKIRVKQCEEENRNLHDTLSAFNKLDDNSSQVFLIDQFENDLNQIQKRIDSRSLLITSIEKKSSRRKEGEYKNQSIFQEKTQLIAENQQLINKALFLEKKMIAAKLKLRLSHDHRDFCRLKRQLVRLANYDENPNEEENEILHNKIMIRNLKNAIEHEKKRLMRITSPPTIEEEAAEIIQKVWRGYVVRKEKGKTTTTPNNETNSDASVKDDNSQFPELNNSEIEDNQEVENVPIEQTIDTNESQEEANNQIDNEQTTEEQNPEAESNE